MITQSELKSLLLYDYTTGLFRDHLGNKKGCDDGSGYVCLRLNNKTYRAHRLAWLYVYGEFPKNHIDHINRNKSDNRICNLRDISQCENNKNTGIRKDNKSGTKGVCWNKRLCKWHVRIGVNGKFVTVGYFYDLCDALFARKVAEYKYGY